MKYFTIREMCESTTADRRGIDNTPSKEITAHLTALIDNALDSVREAWGHGIRITSGYRCAKLNTAIGGAKRSAHMTGYAADTKPTNGDMAGYQKTVLKWAETHKFDQIIIEYPDSKNLAKWIHIGYMSPSGTQRKQILSTDGKGYYVVSKASRFYNV